MTVIEESRARQFGKPADIRDYMLAGNARLTLVSNRTQNRYTFKVRRAKGTRTPTQASPWFVSVLSGPDNENDYQFMGCVWQRTVKGDNYKRPQDTYYEYQHGSKKQRTRGLGATDMSPSGKTFKWFFTMLFDMDTLHPELQVWHEGRCGKCGRALTVPESIARGIGPECYAKGEG